MARTLQIQRNCPSCNQPRLFTKPGVSHLLHAILTLFLCGFWFPIWVLAGLVNAAQAYRCSQCGTAADAPARKLLAIAGGAMILCWAWGTYRVAAHMAGDRNGMSDGDSPKSSERASYSASPALDSLNESNAAYIAKQLEEARQSGEKKKAVLANKTLAWHQAMAATNSPFGLFRMGQRYAAGDGVEKDPTQARAYFRRALIAGSPDAQAELDKLSAPAAAPPQK